MTEYGYDIGNAKVYQDKELTLEFDVSHLTREDWERIIGGIPIVRCKDCRYYKEDERWCRRLGLVGAFAKDGFCSRGERREDGVDC